MITDNPWRFDVVQTGAGNLAELAQTACRSALLRIGKDGGSGVIIRRWQRRLRIVVAAAPGDVVWDPFIGSGGELCEVFLRSRACGFWAGDVDAEALAARRRRWESGSRSVGAAKRRCAVAVAARRDLRGDQSTDGATGLPGRSGTTFGTVRGPCGATAAAGRKICWLNPLPNQTSHLLADHGMRRKIFSRRRRNGFGPSLSYGCALVGHICSW